MLLKTFERLIFIACIALTFTLYAHQVTENLRIHAKLQRIEIRINQLTVDLKYYTDPDVIQERTIKRLLGQEERKP